MPKSGLSLLTSYSVPEGARKTQTSKGVPWDSLEDKEKLSLLFVTGAWQWVNSKVGDDLRTFKLTGALSKCMSDLKFDWYPGANNTGAWRLARDSQGHGSNSYLTYEVLKGDQAGSVR